MDSDLKLLLQQERITPIEAYMKASDKSEFENLIDPESLAQLIAGG